MVFSLSYDLENVGWARLILTDGPFRADIGVSYRHDSLRELAEAAKALKNGAIETRTIFVDEPGEVHLVFVRDDEGLTYQVQQFAGWESQMNVGEVPHVLYQGTTTPAQFVGEVRKELESVLKTHKIGGYRKRWMNHDFPMDLLFHLQLG